MLDIAFKYEDQLKEMFMEKWYDSKYKYYYVSPFRSIYNAQEAGIYSRQFVSLNKNNEIVGFTSYEISEDTNIASGLCAINFSDTDTHFIYDLVQVIDDIFCKFNMAKLEFMVVVGNPIENSYDRLVKRYGGSIEGVFKKHVRLYDGEYYDEKCYGLFRESYLKAKNR